jgi:hypothetical protein
MTLLAAGSVAHLTPDQARAFVRKVMGPPRRELQGKEREQVLLMLAMLGKPTWTSNNQHCYSEDYVHADRHWSVTTWPDGYYTVEEIERETDQ